jgi:tetratricopeptide (TPR) repeat protein
MNSRQASTIAWVATAAFLLVPVSTSLAISQDVNEWLANYNRAEKQYRIGAKQFTDGNYDKAIESYQKALDILPSYSDAALYLGVSLYKQGDYQAALEQVNNSKSVYLDNFNMRQMIKQRQYDEAQSELVQLRTRRSELLATIKLGSQQQQSAKLQKIERMIIDYEQIPHPTPMEPLVPAEYYYHAGNCLLKLQQWNQAFVEYQKAIEIEPGHGESHNNLSYIYFLAKQYEKSWEHMQIAKECGVEVNAQAENALKQKLGK